jgi:hypothetical protein
MLQNNDRFSSKLFGPRFQNLNLNGYNNCLTKIKIFKCCEKVVLFILAVKDLKHGPAQNFSAYRF